MDDEFLSQLIDEAGLDWEKQAIIALYQSLKEKNIISDSSQIKLTSSSGSSVVILLVDDNHDRVYQYYHCLETFKNITELTRRAQTQSQQSLDLIVSGNHFKINYNFDHYRVIALDYWPEFKTIVWEKVRPITQLPSQFIYRHMDQLIWDILKSLNGFHSMKILHGDCCLDNIGIKEGRFVLYDYDLSQTDADLKRDYQIFSRSCYNFLKNEGFTQKLPISNFTCPQDFLMALQNQYKFHVVDIISSFEMGTSLLRRIQDSIPNSTWILSSHCK